MSVLVQCPNLDCLELAEIAEAELDHPRRCERCGREFSPELSSVSDALATPMGTDAGAVAPRPTDLAVGSTFAGRYEIVRRLGIGQQGAVYLAHDGDLGREVALKLPRFNPGASSLLLDRFLREARAAGRIRHPNICPVYDVGRVNDVPYLTMAYIEGEPLSPRIGGLLISPRRAIGLVATLAQALAEAHAQGVVHRDLKPSNVVIQPRGEPVIMDFGLARHIDDVRLTLTGAPLGTPAYMSPEQTRGEDAGAASDIYSLGVILYELLTDHLPFAGPVHAILYQIVHTDPASPQALRSDLDPRVAAICLKAMAKRAEDRFASMIELAKALRGVLDLRPRHHRIITNSIGMDLSLLPAGEFAMGSPDSDPDAGDDEKPQHPVRITRPFYLGVTAVTVVQFRRYFEATGHRTDAERDGKGGWGRNERTGEFTLNPKYTWRTPGYEQTDEHPVVNVSWNDAVAFCEWLSRHERVLYRLPTEAEWEYACRAGTTTRFSSGDDPKTLEEVANLTHTPAPAKPPLRTTSPVRGGPAGNTAPVGRKRANPWGLFDMHGNVWEWCADGYDGMYYSQSPLDDPTGPLQAPARVIRGGGWISNPRHARSAYRHRLSPIDRYYHLGFRVVRVLSGR